MKIEHKIYGFALRGTGRILYRLKTIDSCYLLYPNNIDHYLAMLLHDQPSHIIGLGPSGVFENAINGRISQLINQKRLNSSYNFLLIPKTIKPWVASQKVDKIVKEFSTSDSLTRILTTQISA